MNYLRKYKGKDDFLPYASITFMIIQIMQRLQGKLVKYITMIPREKIMIETFLFVFNDRKEVVVLI